MRPKKTVRTVYKNIAIPEDLAVRIELQLYSDIEGRIPLGAQAKFFEGVLREHFKESDRVLGEHFKESVRAQHKAKEKYNASI